MGRHMARTLNEKMLFSVQVSGFVINLVLHLSQKYKCQPVYPSSQVGDTNENF